MPEWLRPEEEVARAEGLSPHDDGWLLTTESDVAVGGRAPTRRVRHDRDGRHLATMAQAALVPGSG